MKGGNMDEEIRASINDLTIATTKNATILGEMKITFHEHIKDVEAELARLAAFVHKVDQKMLPNHIADHEFLKRKIRREERVDEIIFDLKKSVARWGVLGLLALIVLWGWEGITQYFGEVKVKT